MCSKTGQHYSGHISQDITIVPILVGSISAVDERAYGAILAPYLADRQNLFVISIKGYRLLADTVGILFTRGTRFSYTHYHDPGSSGAAERLGPHTSTPQYPIHKSIECLDKEALEAISIQDPSHAHETLIAYLKRTKNTICGRHPIGVLLGCMIKLQESSSISQQLQFVRYEQSSQCMTVKDSSRDAAT
ncbi:hypothetical protein PSHT_13672 [Puccinia striiformis]|uniref:Uncharacterized protein n=1 Tax=Puccinia striiformis TaxID=27350 RepID=A0A2S4UP56_9BASI|nr:hypothetical protein PSHT_13672 [Puccinia striiformis]